MTTIDEYIEAEQEKGKSGATMNSRCAPTLKHSNFVDIISTGKGGVAVLRPEKYCVVVHSAGADSEKSEVAKYSASLVERLVNQARAISAVPIAFANVVDASTPENLKIELIAEPMIKMANKYKLAIMNGEVAMLGNRVNGVANLSGTMISLVERNSRYFAGGPRIFEVDDVQYAIFDPAEKPVFINSDGVGTKTEFYERAGKYELALKDFMAMTLDDASKRAAKAKVISGVLETRGDIPADVIVKHAAEFAKQIGLFGIIQHEPVGNRITGYDKNMPSYNISGSVVSTIEEKLLKNPPKPRANDYLLAIKGKSNPRSNGITDLRKGMIAMLGDKWHKTVEGRKFLEFLAEPSTILYPMFDELFSRGAASSVYHMSGGAYKDKLAKPLAEHGLFVEIKNMFKPDERMQKLASGTPNEIAYRKWPMGNEAFVTCGTLESAFRIIEKHGLHATCVGQLKKDDKGRTGVELIGIKDSKGENVKYSGMD